MSQWKWKVRCTYNDTVKWPKVPGELAIETVHADDVSKDVEVAAAMKRIDINIDVVCLDEPDEEALHSREEALTVLREMPAAHRQILFKNMNRRIG